MAICPGVPQCFVTITSQIRCPTSEKDLTDLYHRAILWTLLRTSDCQCSRKARFCFHSLSAPQNEAVDINLMEGQARSRFGPLIRCSWVMANSIRPGTSLSELLQGRDIQWFKSRMPFGYRFSPRDTVQLSCVMTSRISAATLYQLEPVLPIPLLTQSINIPR